MTDYKHSPAASTALRKTDPSSVMEGGSLDLIALPTAPAPSRASL
jgi:hypothetical protein